MATLPDPVIYYRESGAADDAWTEAASNEFQATDGVEYEVCCVKASAIKRAIFGTVAFEFATADGNLYATADNNYYGTSA
jgi:hypothetical protein